MSPGGSSIETWGIGKSRRAGDVGPRLLPDHVCAMKRPVTANCDGSEHHKPDIAVAWRQLARTLAEQESGIAGMEARAALEADSRAELAVACLFIKWLATRAPFDLGGMMADFDDFVASQIT
jgi:hypothetical protein